MPIPFSLIKKASDDIVRLFHPDKIILFGSYAYGTPGEESDVDLLVIMTLPEGGQNDGMEWTIRKSLGRPFRMDILVRSPEEVQWRYDYYDPLIRDAVDEGRILYDKKVSHWEQSGFAS